MIYVAIVAVIICMILSIIKESKENSRKTKKQTFNVLKTTLTKSSIVVVALVIIFALFKIFDIEFKKPADTVALIVFLIPLGASTITGTICLLLMGITELLEFLAGSNNIKNAKNKKELDKSIKELERKYKIYIVLIIIASIIIFGTIILAMLGFFDGFDIWTTINILTVVLTIIIGILFLIGTSEIVKKVVRLMLNKK